jgi:MoaA/NifB/PqqE/SkfB family radical SAM enzyme
MNEQVIDGLRAAGLQFLTSSLDALGGTQVKSDGGRVLNLLEYAKAKGIISSTLTVVTRENIHSVYETALEVTQRGIIFDMGLYQHVGGAFSPSDTALKPVSMQKVEQLRKMLRGLKIKTGLVSPSWSYLSETLKRYEALSWKCSAHRDAYLVINNDGSLMTCQEYPEHIPVLAIMSLEALSWREAKLHTVSSCKGCFYGCYYQKQNIRFIDVLYDAYTMFRV